MTTPDGYQIQTFTIEYTVNGPLDGVTVGAPIKAPEKNDDPQQFYRQTVDALGLIDPDYVSGILGSAVVQPDQLGARGNRWIGVLWIEGTNVGAADATVEVVDAVTGTITVQEEVATFVGSMTFYRRKGILIPQGSLLRLRGMPGSAAAPIKVRITLESIDSLEDLALVQKVLCECDTEAAPIITRSRHFNMWVLGETPPVPLQLAFATDFGLAGGAPPSTGGRAASAMFNWIADAAGALEKVTLVQTNDIGAPGSLSLSFQVGAPPFAFVAGTPMGPYVLPTVVTVGPLTVASGVPVDFVIPAAFRPFALHNMLGVFISGWDAGPISSAAQVEATATCQWRSA